MINNIPFFINAMGDQDEIFLSAFSRYVINVRKKPSISLEDITVCKQRINECDKIDEILILPSTEYLNRVLLDITDDLRKEGVILPLCPKELYLLISDKYSFGKLCIENDILVPDELYNPQLKDIPFVAKPKQYFNDWRKMVAERPFLVKDELSYRQLKKNKTLFYQKYVKGKSIYLLYYFSKEGTYSVYSQENLLQQSQGKSIIGAISSDIHLDLISKKFAQLLLGLRFCGLIMIELRSFNGQFYMIEANPRLWGPSQLILDAGMNLFYLFANDYNLVTACNTAIGYKSGVRYFWSGGIFEDQGKGNEISLYGYDKDLFFEEYSEWLKSDIYLREDTVRIFLKNAYTQPSN
ncbi:MAG TPA: hypothetical protein VHA52_09635 [Candidatus Babeliaceae bacterium]|nr:hypothetical protein [Candidatus Babeliaceae bacterium]